MRLTCIIVEDQPPAQRILKKFIEETKSLELTATFANAIDAMEFMSNQKVDVLFLDIHLPKLNGIDFLKSLAQRPQVILTTAFSEYALEGYDLNVIDYLLKPFSFERFVQAIQKLKFNGDEPTTLVSAEEQEDSIFVKSGHDYIKIDIDDIIMIHSDSDYTEVHLSSNKVLSNESLRHWLTTLNKNQFIQLHKSYIVNTAKIERISGNQVIMKQQIVVPIGRAYKEQFMKRLIP